MATRPARILMALAFVLLVTGLGLAPRAVADGDPAGNVLLGDNVFYPYAPTVTASVQKILNAETAAAKRAGFPIKVALIGSPVDLGVIPTLFGHPQQYADSLDPEISFRRPQPLLVVMAAGYGVQGIAGPAKLAVPGLARPAGSTPTALGRAAIAAVARLASASGHDLKNVPGVPSASGDRGGSGGTAPILIGLAAAAVLVAGALIVVRLRSSSRPAEPPGNRRPAARGKSPPH